MKRSQLLKALLTVAAWFSTILAVWAALAILNTIFLVPGDHIWAFKIIMAVGLALLSFVLARTAEWCFRNRNRH
jgi:hypothetical protein